MDHIAVGVASAAMNGEQASGDQHVVRVLGDITLVAAIDGLGHGQEALRAALATVAAVESARDLSLVPLLQECHARLHTTRGATMSIAIIDLGHRAMTWLGVGNVAGTLFHGSAGLWHTQRTPLVQAAGVVGHRLPTLQPVTVPIAPRDTLVLATDGVRDDFEQMVSAGIDVQVLADRILSKHRIITDDALVLVARPQVGPP